MYFGTPYPLNIHHAEIDTPQVELKWNIFLAKTPIANDQQLIANGLRQAFTRWYTKTGTEAISYRAEYFAHLIGVTFNKLRLKEVKTLWGSCSPKNNLTFNWKLVMAPAEVIDYVVVHELCHLRERNHSKRFWTLVKEFAPDYKVHRKWLKENEWQLSI